MPDPSNWCLIFSDGTGQRGVRDDREGRPNDYGVRSKNTNVFQMYVACCERPYLTPFYDPGLGSPDEGQNGWGRAIRNVWAKATGWGISANIADCYEAILINWRPGMKIGLFGFSRGAYTARCVGGVLAVCGIATTDRNKPISREGEVGSDKARRKIAEAAVAAYAIKDDHERREAGQSFARLYDANTTMPSVIGVFDTVESLGLPGVLNVVNPWKQKFHDRVLNPRIPLGLHALSIDENRKAFLPVMWEPGNRDTPAVGQVIEQCWFPGVHSDIGGGYDEQKLSDLTLDWMLSRLRDVAHLHIPLTVEIRKNLLDPAHDERTGMGVFWLPAERTIAYEAIDNAALCAGIEDRFEGLVPAYRPPPLGRHPRVRSYY